MLELEAARERILAALPAARAERVPVATAHRRILAEPITSPVDLPPFDNSAMDGYALRAADLAGAASTPASLRCIGRVAAGDIFPGEVSAGDCVRIFTGSPLPRGADAVIMQEDTRVDPANPGLVQCLDAVKPWENIRFKGEDVKLGAIVGEAGDAIDAARIGLLSAAGLTHVRAGKQPVVGLLATGSELLEPGQTMVPGKIYESNRATLAALASSAGGIPKTFPLVKDTLADTVASLREALAGCDLLVTSGGVSVGETDFVKDAFQQLGGQIDFWRIAIRPGRPFVFGRCGEKFLFGLPGNPVSAFVTFLLLAWPAIARWQGETRTQPPSRTVTLAEPLHNSGDRRHFMRVAVDSSGNARNPGGQASHALASLAAANALVDVPAQSTLPAGAMVQALGWS